MRKILLFLSIIISIATQAQTKPANLYRADTAIVINLSDATFGQLTLKRKATFQTMIYNTNAKQLSLAWLVNYYVDSSGSYGALVTLPGISSYPVEFIADNNTYVDASTGAIQTYDSTYSSNGGYNPSITLMTQYEWFTHVGATQAIIVDNLIAEFGAQGFIARGY